MYYMLLDSFCEVSLPVGPPHRRRSFSTPAVWIAGGRVYRRGLQPDEVLRWRRIC